jgi:hypothetical protein
VYYLYGFVESLQSIHDHSGKIPAGETVAASVIIVLSMACLTSWVSSMRTCQTKSNGPCPV